MHLAPSTVAPEVAQKMFRNGQRVIDVSESKDAVSEQPSKTNHDTSISPSAPLNVHNIKWNKDNAASYLEQLKKANQNVICTSKGTKVGKVTPDFLLRQGLRIPLFQRRYCWTAAQWNQLYRDATALADGRSSSHSLGRITCVETGEGLVVIDGQQRNTSCVLLLAAIRDVCLTQSREEDADYVNGKIFNGRKGDELLAYLKGKTELLDEDETPPGCVLTPTFCDRSSFFSAVLPPSQTLISNSSWCRPLEAKEYFVQRLLKEGRDGKNLKKLATAILTRFQWLYFPLDVDGTVREDGTANLNLIFERLALREAMFCRPPKMSMYATMEACDFVRNLLLGGFGDESKAKEVYQTYWLPVEKKADAAGKRENIDPGMVMETLLTAFLSHHNIVDRKRDVLDTMIGGNLYALFRDYALKAQQEENSSNLELIVHVHEFSMAWLDGNVRDQVGHNSFKQGQGERQAERRSDKWACPRCNFPNDGSSRLCTACSFFRT
ncbi:hypothetical protein TrCOL_g5866 [Triparma columacea]|uniref:RanBP2-type domain-containing protein n=1 Tax=Triparma columacea TaxID=722753 RepID=A0A9W7LE66_9STRA|nr:hypothetical protein TrCOL_g5866 [Triparma columacea]